jgi:hypothetical protein
LQELKKGVGVKANQEDEDDEPEELFTDESTEELLVEKEKYKHNSKIVKQIDVIIQARASKTK